MLLAYCRTTSGHADGRKLLETLYRSQTGQPLPEILLGEFGKPYFRDSAWFFSISHTDRHVFCALSRSPIGIDAEELDRPVTRRHIRRILSDGERAQMEAAPSFSRAFLTFWVLKEAYYKCLGTGLRGFPNRTAFRLDDPRVQEIDGCLVAAITEESL